ncbi:MAG TPA: ATP-binding cassette domain-containing protein [Paenibacillus sp.]|uniref:phosphonate ABC transporter ATP-binding protein n=1 Tax=Paenibacillus sp. TaxID=58172 RepID=UPI002BE9BC7C|nr:ATP-binding cassette domain-containing protein [Paenibacillus sp.]HUC90568.1 ATP-binding cassette domain-containing protein [Paenibacillus sp.]
MIKVMHLMKKIPNGPTVLNDVTFQTDRGELIAVMGASGSGKSMLLRCLALRETWSGGSLWVDGVDVFRKGFAAKLKLWREFAYLEEKPALNPNRTALKNTLVGTRYQTPWWRMLTGMVRSDDYMGAMDMLEKVGLLDKAHAKAAKLSGGERQRVAIARALVHGAKVILADEPVTGLDPHAAEAILTDLRNLCHTQGVTMIVVLSQSDWAERFADRILGLNRGELVFDITGRRLTQREKTLL